MINAGCKVLALDGSETWNGSVWQNIKLEANYPADQDSSSNPIAIGDYLTDRNGVIFEVVASTPKTSTPGTGVLDSKITITSITSDAQEYNDNITLVDGSGTLSIISWNPSTFEMVIGINDGVSTSQEIASLIDGHYSIESATVTGGAPADPWTLGVGTDQVTLTGASIWLNTWVCSLEHKSVTPNSGSGSPFPDFGNTLFGSIVTPGLSGLAPLWDPTKVEDKVSRRAVQFTIEELEPIDIDAIIGGAPDTLNTLGKIGDSIRDTDKYADTVEGNLPSVGQVGTPPNVINVESIPGAGNLTIDIVGPQPASAATGSIDDYIDIVSVAGADNNITVEIIDGAAVAATLNLDQAGVNNALLYTAKTAGTGGNIVTIAYTTGGLDGDTSTSASAVGNDITVHLGNNGAGITAVTNDIITAIEADSPGADDLVSVVLGTDSEGTGNDGSGAPIEVTATNLTGGLDAVSAGGETISFDSETDTLSCRIEDGASSPVTFGALIATDSHIDTVDASGAPNPWILNAAATAATGSMDTRLTNITAVSGEAGNVKVIFQANQDVSAGFEIVEYDSVAETFKVYISDGNTTQDQIKTAMEAHSLIDSVTVASGTDPWTTPTTGVAATLTVDCTNTDSDILYTATYEGDQGNNLSVEYVEPSADDASLSINAVGNKLTVNLAKSGGSVTTTAAEIIGLVNALSSLVTAEPAETTGAGVVEAKAAANLTGGVTIGREYTYLTGGKEAGTDSVTLSGGFDATTAIAGSEQLVQRDDTTLEITIEDGVSNLNHISLALKFSDLIDVATPTVPDYTWTLGGTDTFVLTGSDKVPDALNNLRKVANSLGGDHSFKNNILDGAPLSLDTIGKLANALNNNPNFSQQLLGTVPSDLNSLEKIANAINNDPNFYTNLISSAPVGRRTFGDISVLIDSLGDADAVKGDPPPTLDSVEKLADAINNDPNYYLTVQEQLDSKLGVEDVDNVGMKVFEIDVTDWASGVWTLPDGWEAVKVYSDTALQVTHTRGTKATGVIDDVITVTSIGGPTGNISFTVEDNGLVSGNVATITGSGPYVIEIDDGVTTQQAICDALEEMDLIYRAVPTSGSSVWNLGASAVAATYTVSGATVDGDVIYTADATGVAGNNLSISHLNPGSANPTLSVEVYEDKNIVVTLETEDVAADATIEGVTYTADTAGADGNNITITYVDPGAASQALSISVVGNNIIANLATDGSSIITSTQTEVRDAINGHGTASTMVTGSGGDGTVVNAVSTTSLTGGITSNPVSTATEVETLVNAHATVQATRTIQDLTVTAVTTGSSGNAIKLQVVDDTSESLDETSDTITIHINTGTTDTAGVAALINGGSLATSTAGSATLASAQPLSYFTGGVTGASDLVDVTYGGTGAGVASVRSSVNLTGGRPASTDAVTLSGGAGTYPVGWSGRNNVSSPITAIVPTSTTTMQMPDNQNIIFTNIGWPAFTYNVFFQPND